jgi:hypothetical protein
MIPIAIEELLRVRNTKGEMSKRQGASWQINMISQCENARYLGDGDQSIFKRDSLEFASH